MSSRIAKYVLRLIGTAFLKSLGWRVVGAYPQRPSVIILAPHTSNWDFFLFIALELHWGVVGRIVWFAKKEIFRWPWKSFLEGIGGIPVDRHKHGQLTNIISEHLKNEKNVSFALAPEGTRKKTASWKKGYYYIACAAERPISLAFVNFEKKEVGIGPTFDPTGDEAVDWQPIRDFYQREWAKYPNQFSDMNF